MDEIVDIEVEDAPRHDPRILILAAAAGTAVVLFFFARALSKRTSAVPPSVQDAMDAGDWKTSLEHLAAGWETRFMLLQEQLDRLSGDTAPTAPPAPAAVSLPADGVAPTGAPVRVPPDMSIVGAEDAPPPGPAAVSMPPGGEWHSDNP